MYAIVRPARKQGRSFNGVIYYTAKHVCVSGHWNVRFETLLRAGDHPANKGRGGKANQPDINAAKTMSPRHALATIHHSMVPKGMSEASCPGTVPLCLPKWWCAAVNSCLLASTKESYSMSSDYRLYPVLFRLEQNGQYTAITLLSKKKNDKDYLVQCIQARPQPGNKG
jgi:hypothetical protein